MFDKLRGKKIVVDASIYLYKFLENDMLLENLYLMCSLFRYYNIKPLFVFDGKPPPEKKKEIGQRLQKRKDNLKQLLSLEERLENTENGLARKIMQRKIKTLIRNTISITSKDYKEIKAFLDNYGIQWVIAEGEADVLCATIVKEGRAYACLSEDMDLFVYGCPIVLRYMSLINHCFVIYDLHQILSALQIPFKEFQIICILSGTDYNHSNKNIYLFYNLYKLFKFSKETCFCTWLEKKIHLDKNIYSIITLFNVTIETQKLNIQFESVRKNQLIQQLESKNFVFA